MTGSNGLTLAGSLDLTAAPGLRLELQAVLARGTAVVDAGAVTRVATPCLEVLAAAAGTGRVRFAPVSGAFREAAHALGLAAALGLEGGAEDGNV